MADAILYGVVQTIIESLGSSTLQPIGSIWGVKDDLEKMKNTVLAIQAVLQDAEEQQVENHQVKHWLMNLRDAVYDADDLLSEFTTHVLQQQVMDGDKIVKKGPISVEVGSTAYASLKEQKDFKWKERREEDSRHFEVQS
ncbi:hypothetical protein CMV_012078 [Castanea mollissima]|uniref:Disease resistance N-terminal domain-containing protein n=1 Tax=Castanea mollissima TaxID=60419 RepID=A0A8J4R229_9ROSI|nr:hypothetical protein CMV_012078 [Castanea mollissima]